MSDRRFSLTSCNIYHFQDGELDLELCCHPVLRRETISFDGQIAYEVQNPAPGWGHSFEFNGHEYTLMQDRPEDGSCNYYYELSRNEKPVQRYEITNTRKIRPAIIWLVALCVVICIPVAAGELSEAYLGVSVLDWSQGVGFAVVIGTALSAISLVGLIVGIYGQPTIKKCVLDEAEPGIVLWKFEGDKVSICEVQDSR